MNGDNPEIGFSLDEVLSAVRAYGLEPMSKSPPPNVFTTRPSEEELIALSEPSADRIESARCFRHLSTQTIPGTPSSICLRNIMHLLAEGVPVAIDLRWPHWRSMPGATLSEQTPMTDGSHAVLLVGFTGNTGNTEDIRFIFRNSWGASWGANGFGFAKFGYLEKNLIQAVIVEVPPPPP